MRLLAKQTGRRSAKRRSKRRSRKHLEVEEEKWQVGGDWETIRVEETSSANRVRTSGSTTGGGADRQERRTSEASETSAGWVTVDVSAHRHATCRISRCTCRQVSLASNSRIDILGGNLRAWRRLCEKQGFCGGARVNYEKSMSDGSPRSAVKVMWHVSHPANQRALLCRHFLIFQQSLILALSRLPAAHLTSGFLRLTCRSLLSAG
ncbi:unnamed protein product, partial [Protopolystoma xenopodis]